MNDNQTRLNFARVKVRSREYDGVPQLLNEDVMAGLQDAQLTEARSILGRAYRHLGQYSLARAQLRLAVGDRPMGPGAAEDYYALGVSYEKLDQPMEALAALEHASNLMNDKDDAASRSLNYLICMDGGAAALAARRVDKSKEFYQRAVDMAPSKPEKGPGPV